MELEQLEAERDMLRGQVVSLRCLLQDRFIVPDGSEEATVAASRSGCIRAAEDIERDELHRELASLDFQCAALTKAVLRASFMKRESAAAVPSRCLSAESPLSASPAAAFADSSQFASEQHLELSRQLLAQLAAVDGLQLQLRHQRELVEARRVQHRRNVEMLERQRCVADEEASRFAHEHAQLLSSVDLLLRRRRPT